MSGPDDVALGDLLSPIRLVCLFFNYIDGSTLGVNQVPLHNRDPEGFRHDDKVSFTDKHRQHQVETITRIQQRTATVDCEGGAGWREPLVMLRHDLDF